MYSAYTQRLVKEILMRLHQISPAYSTIPVYYLPWDNKTPESARMAIDSVQKLPCVPWPDDNCIVIAEEALSSMVFNDNRSLVAYVKTTEELLNQHKNTSTTFDNHKEICNKFEDGYLYLSAGPNADNNSIGIKTGIFAIKKMKVSEAFNYDYFQDVDKMVSQLKNEFQLTTPELISKMKQFVRILMPKIDAEEWVAIPVIVDRGDTKIKGFADLASASPFTGADTMLHLSNIATPSAYTYFVKTQFNRPFGTKGFQKLFNNKPIISVVHYDRLHKINPNRFLSKNDMPFHFRRGHLRHHWKLSGIDRMSLPECPADRLKLVHDHNVMVTYVSPSWVGCNNFDFEGANFSIMTEELKGNGTRFNFKA